MMHKQLNTIRGRNAMHKVRLGQIFLHLIIVILLVLVLFPFYILLINV